MKVVGFNLHKISAERKEENLQISPSTSIEFNNIEKEKLDFFKEGEILKIFFKYSLNYEEKSGKKSKEVGKIIFEGRVLLSVSDEESTGIMKSWKKKQMPPNMNVFLFNLILRKCTPKAIFLEDEVNLPFHTPMPKLKPKQESD